MIAERAARMVSASPETAAATTNAQVAPLVLMRMEFRDAAPVPVFVIRMMIPVKGGRNARRPIACRTLAPQEPAAQTMYVWRLRYLKANPVTMMLPRSAAVGFVKILAVHRILASKKAHSPDKLAHMKVFRDAVVLALLVWSASQKKKQKNVVQLTVPRSTMNAAHFCVTWAVANAKSLPPPQI